MIQKIKNIIADSIKVKEAILHDETLHEHLDILSTKIVQSLKNGGRVYFCGNGGSAADAQHLAAELSGRFYTDRPALAAEALHSNSSYLTAVANDYSYDVVYKRIIEGVGKPGDILIGISTSGNSKNVVLALEAAQQRKMITVSFSGEGGGKMKLYSDFIFAIPSTDTPRIQECHILVGHILCQLIEEKYFSQ